MTTEDEWRPGATTTATPGGTATSTESGKRPFATGPARSAGSAESRPGWQAPRGATGGGAAGSARAGQWVPTLVILLTIAVAVLGVATVYLAGRLDQIESIARSNGFISSVQTVPTSISTLPLAPVVVPPADESASMTAIIDVYRQVFAQGQPAEVRRQLIDSPDSVQGDLTTFASGSCAIESVAVVTGVDFTSDNTANVSFRFEGPNVPEVGRGYVFSGSAGREPGGQWKVGFAGVNSVIDISRTYCN